MDAGSVTLPAEISVRIIYLFHILYSTRIRKDMIIVMSFYISALLDSVSRSIGPADILSFIPRFLH